jgi:hypothetical protein
MGRDATCTRAGRPLLDFDGPRRWSTPCHAARRRLAHAIHFATGPVEQKALNLRSNRYVTLTTGCNEWEGGLDVVVEGEAVPVTDEDMLERLAEAWAKKWDGRWRYEVHESVFRHEGGTDAVLVFSVTPAKVLAFAKGPFGQTRHRF